MKTLSLLSLCALMGIGLLTSSCAKTNSSSPTTTPTPVVSASTMSATVGGASWTSSSASGTSAYGITELSGVRTSDASAFVITLAQSTPGTYTVDGFTTSIGYEKNTTTSPVTYTASTGTIVISTNASGTMTGTFNGNVANTSNSSDVIAVTNGSFSIKF